MAELKDKERLAYEMFSIIEQSANGTGEVIDEDAVWQSFMEICNARCGTEFTSPDAARMAVSRISSTIPLDRLEELYEEATGREINLDRPIQYPWGVKDRCPQEVKQTLALLSPEVGAEEPHKDDLMEFYAELASDCRAELRSERRSKWRKGFHKRFSQT